MGIDDRGHDRVCGRGFIIHKLRAGDLVGVVARHRQPEVNPTGHGNDRGTQLRPMGPIIAAEARKDIAHPIEAQPGIWIVDWKCSTRCRRPVGHSAVLEKAPHHRRRGDRGGKCRALAQTGAGHQTRLRPEIREPQAGQTHAHVKIAGERFQ